MSGSEFDTNESLALVALEEEKPSHWTKPAPPREPPLTSDIHVQKWVGNILIAIGVGIIASLVLSLPAHASCHGNHMTYGDKFEHAAGSALIAGAAVGVTKNEWMGLGTAIAIGAAKEWADNYNPKECVDIKDFAADVIGAYIGIRVGRLMIKPHSVQYTVAF